MKENNLIFLISQPRSGSTLLQKIIGNHSKIYTRSEPWIMLPFAYSLKKTGNWSEYDNLLYQMASNDFISNLSEGKTTYLNELKSLSLNLYKDYLNKSKCEFFLDKTPRYYFIYKELLEIFPNSKYILLIRNPLAILNSILTTWVKDDYNKLSKYKYDLFFAIKYITNLEKESNIHLIKYENLLASPVEKVKEIFNYLDINYEEGLFTHRNREKMFFGDPENVYKYKNIKANNDNAWIKSLKNPDYFNFIYEYLLFIGKDVFNKLGYDFDENLKILLDNKPKEISNSSLYQYLDTTDYFSKEMYSYLDNKNIQKNSSYEFNKKYSQLFEKISQLKDDKTYIIYGFGSIGKTIFSLLNKCNVYFIDKESKNIDKNISVGKVYSPENLPNMKYDKIIISVLGREDEIIKYLVEKLQVNRNNILVLNI